MMILLFKLDTVIKDNQGICMKKQPKSMREDGP